ncbi:MAG: hypothetical protein R3B99_35240 [Polyangiales bacterium]
MTDRDRRVVLGNGAVVMERIERHDDAGHVLRLRDDGQHRSHSRLRHARREAERERMRRGWSSTFETEAVDDMVGLVRSVYVDGLSAVRDALDVIETIRNSPDWQTFRGFVRDRDTGRDGDLGVICAPSRSRARPAFEGDL